MVQLPVIDLDKVSDAQELLPLVKSILNRSDTFLIKNYANKEHINTLLAQLPPPDAGQGFDANFTGTLVEGSFALEQYIANTDTKFHFSRKCTNASLSKLYSLLFKIGLYFAQLCLQAIGKNDLPLSEVDHATILSRYYNRENQTKNELPDGQDFEYTHSKSYIEHQPQGILTIFPVAQNIRYKPSTSSIEDNSWTLVQEPECLFLHTGQTLALLSNGAVSTSPLKISQDDNNVCFTIFPPLGTNVNSQSTIAGDILLNQQIKEHNKVAEKYYSKQLKIINLKEKLQLYKELFNASESVLSLKLISNVIPGKSIELYSLLPQMSNMMKRKITEETFLKMISIWPEAYVINANSKAEITIQLPKTNSLQSLTNKSRRLEYVQKADLWLQNLTNSNDIPEDLPLTKLNKRRGSETDLKKPVLPAPKSRMKSYLHNKKEDMMPKEKNSGSQVALLERIREKERRSAALLSQRQHRYQQFLAVKMTKLFDILYSLPEDKPHTATYLNSLIVDSLQDSNNPIGLREATEVLEKLQRLLPHKISVHTVEGGLKVYRWNHLDRADFESRIADYKKSTKPYNDAKILTQTFQ